MGGSLAWFGSRKLLSLSTRAQRIRPMSHEQPFILSQQTSIFSAILAELRDETIQQDRQRFRHNVERASELLAYEISRNLKYAPRTVHTPLGSVEVPVLREQPIIGTILRAGLAMQHGFLRMFDQADHAFIAAYRQHNPSARNQFEIMVEYISAPDLTDRPLILVDPMIATGRTLVLTVEELMRYGTPSTLYISGIIASEEGVEYVQRHIPQARLYIGAVDYELTAQGYIVPGLGDAGDLAFGNKN